MRQEFEKYFKYFYWNTKNEEHLVSLKLNLEFDLPGDYIEIMREHDGGEGEIGAGSWLQLFSLSELISLNEDYNLLMEQIPDLFLFGKDAADTGYAFHKFNRTFHSFGLMSNFETDYIDFCGNNFLEFLEYLYNKE
ncbi:hypothetical protein CPT03_00790 [Pedobacter ginsengisoli]|uniref:Knr4/Smi1-like domain-containing protein n=1 Tax=Pedobacter ginsengisoli TaxID=363852 RepID=A0A2D1U0I9_9SPHI|nr:SMI1/KNR4 family protein [Pedobacter ginsengisoli]ATP55107.1 hypothetical protein CPT03_00790 [Pedobacter ginsengisoli]